MAFSKSETKLYGAPAPARAADHGLVRTKLAALLLLAILHDVKKRKLSISNRVKLVQGMIFFCIVVHYLQLFCPELLELLCLNDTRTHVFSLYLLAYICYLWHKHSVGRYINLFCSHLVHNSKSLFIHAISTY